MSLRNHIIAQAWKMKVGECLTIDRRTFMEAFPSNPFPWLVNIPPPIDQLLESLPGANFGAYKATQNQFNGDISLCRYECGEKRVRHDWDRRDLPL